MSIRLSCRGQNMIEYMMLVLAVVVVVLSVAFSKNGQGKSIFGAAVNTTTGATAKFIDRRDADPNIKFKDIDGNDKTVAARGH